MCHEKYHKYNTFKTRSNINFNPLISLLEDVRVISKISEQNERFEVKRIIIERPERVLLCPGKSCDRSQGCIQTHLRDESPT